MSLSQSHSNRFTALDGLRGISSFLVVLSHLKLGTPTFSHLIDFVPLRILVKSFLNAGIISVGYFFILCGFLMVYLYENPSSYIGFVQKRYFRIFSVFLVAVVISFGVITLGFESVIHLIALLVLIPILLRLIYVVLFRAAKNKFVPLFFFSLIGLQILVALMNYMIVFRIDPQQYAALPQILHTSSVFLTNATLSFVFTDYITMLDGGYWSLVSEVLFYLMYPILAVILIQPIRRLSARYWVLWYFVSMIFCYGLFLLFRNLLAFETAHIHFAHFFTIGMMIALAYKSQNHVLTKLIRFFDTPVGQVVSLFLYLTPLYLAYWVGILSDPFRSTLIVYVFSPIMCLAVIATLAHNNLLSRIFRMRILLFLGAISFPLYVIHSPIIHVLWKTMDVEHNLNLWPMYFIFAVSMSIIAAYYLHVIIERFYFIVTKQTKVDSEANFNVTVLGPSLRSAVLRQVPIASRMHDKVGTQDDTAEKQSHRISGNILVPGSFILCITLVFVAFQQDFSLTTTIQPHDRDSLKLERSTSTDYSLQKITKLRGLFKAQEDKLGIITLDIRHQGSLEQDRGTQEFRSANILIFRIREKGSKMWYHESQHIAWKIAANKPYAFGFPEILHSKYTWYEFELESKDAADQDYVVLIDPKTNFRSVYKMSKSTLFQSPLTIVPIIYRKALGAYSQPEAQLIFCIYALTLGFVWLIQRKGLTDTKNG